MIPKALFISFLSISLPSQLSRVSRYEAAEAGPYVVDPIQVTVGSAVGAAPELHQLGYSPVGPQAGVPQTPLISSATDDYHEAGSTEIDVSPNP